MKRFIALGAATLILLGTAACSDNNGDSKEIGVMTWNIYVGADLNPILTETDPNKIPERVLEAFLAMQSTNFVERSRAIADEIVRERPHLIGLQEVSIIRLQSPGDLIFNPPGVPADTEYLNFKNILLAELARRGVSYSAVATSVGFDVEMPMVVGIDPLAFDDVRLTDQEVLLARDDVQVADVIEGHFQYNLEVPLPTGSSIVLRMGWVSVETEIEDQEFRFVSTHLETAEFAPPIQEAQAAELIQMLSEETLPIVLVGDFNSDADGSTTDTYSMLLNAGYRDAWLEAADGESEYTCCQVASLVESSNLDRRIDYIFVSDGFEVRSIRRIGADQEDRTLSGLWPSDHAGLKARLRLP